MRSQFEHCSPVWRPRAPTAIKKFDNFQKKCVKWIFKEESYSYSKEVYLRKCFELNILPLEYRFQLADLILFHKIFYKLIPLSLPDYLKLYDNSNSRLRSRHLDSLSFTSDLNAGSNSTNNLQKSFFFRGHRSWNSLPLEIRETSGQAEFKTKLIGHLKSLARTETCDWQDDWSQISDDGG